MDGSKSAPLAKAWVQLTPTLDGAQRQITKELGGVGGPAGKSAGKSFGTGFTSGLRPIALAGGALLAGGFAVDFAKDAIAEASDLNESLNAVDVVFKKNSDAIKEMGASAAETLGLSNVEFNGLVTQFGGFAKAIGGKGKGVVKFLDNITGRAADFASVMNLDVSEAAQLFQSGLAGETEPLRRFGIDMSAAAVQAYAYAAGIAKSGSQLTEAQKVQARYGLLMKETAQTQGDFANTSDGLANSQRILNAEWANAKAELGAKLLPLMQETTHWLVDEGLPALQGFIDDLGDPSSTIGGLAQSLGDLWDSSKGPIGDLLKGAGDVGAKVASGLSTGINTAKADGWAQVAEDWVDGAAVAGDAMSKWAASGEGWVQDFVGAVDLVVAGATDGNILQNWSDGLGIIADRDKVGPRDPQLLASDFAHAMQSAQIDFQKQALAESMAPHTVTADPNAKFGSGPQTINVYVDTVVSSNTDDFIRKSQTEARTNSSSGARTTKASGSPYRRHI